MLPLLLLLLLFPLDDKPASDDPEAGLAKVRRIYVDILTGGDSALRIRDMLMTSLQNSKLFIVTEDAARADATLKGAAEDSAFNHSYQWSEGLNSHSQLNTSSSSQVAGRSDHSSLGTASGVGDNESRRTEERRHEAIVTVRLVNKDGDVIWSTTQESLGGKFIGASADVADKVSKKLAADYRKAKLGPAQ